MHNSKVTLIRLGAVSLSLAGICGVVGMIIVGNNLEYDLVVHPQSAAQRLSSTNHQIWAALTIAFYITAIFGWLGLYFYLSKGRAAGTALWGMFLSILSMVVLLPCWGVWSYAATAGGQLYLQGNKEAIPVYKAIEDSVSLPASLTVLVLIMGLVLFCVAVWQDNTLPKAAMIVLTISLSLFNPILPLFAAIIDAVILALAASWLAFSMWQRTNPAHWVTEPASFNQTVTH